MGKLGEGEVAEEEGTGKWSEQSGGEWLSEALEGFSALTTTYVCGTMPREEI